MVLEGLRQYSAYVVSNKFDVRTLIRKDIKSAIRQNPDAASRDVSTIATLFPEAEDAKLERDEIKQELREEKEDIVLKLPDKVQLSEPQSKQTLNERSKERKVPATRISRLASYGSK